MILVTRGLRAPVGCVFPGWRRFRVLDVPTGTITLLFTDIEGSTLLLQQLGEQYSHMLAQCQQLLRTAFQQFHGHEVDTQGDAADGGWLRGPGCASRGPPDECWARGPGAALADHAAPGGAPPARWGGLARSGGAPPQGLPAEEPSLPTRHRRFARRFSSSQDPRHLPT